jgi:hypothetical protein
MALSIDSLRLLLASGLQWPETDVGAYLAALRGRGLLQSGDAPLRTENAGLAILALLSGFPPAQAVDEALRLSNYHSAGTSTQRGGAGWASIACTPAPGGIPLLLMLTALMTEIPAGGWIMPDGGCLYRLRRVFGPQTDLVLLEGFRHEGEATVLPGLYFTDATARPTASDRSLTMQIETSLSWLLVEEIAAQLGPVASDQMDNLSVRSADAPRPTNSVMH